MDMLRASRQEFLCVQRSEGDALAYREASCRCESGRDGKEGRTAWGLAQTLHKGARVTESMAAAAMSELLGSPLEMEKFEDL